MNAFQEVNQQRIREAQDIILRCIGREGIYAGTWRYKYQCFTRDLVFAGEDALLSLGYAEVIKRQLLGMASLQQENGKLPIVYTDNLLGFLRIRLPYIVSHPIVSWNLVKFYMQKMGSIRGFSFQNITPWTTDSEALFIVGCYKYTRAVRDRDFLNKIKPHIKKAFAYIKSNLKDNLLYGADWRDASTGLDHTALLSNNTLLYYAYTLADKTQDAFALKKKLNTLFWTGSYYRDRLGSNEFDTLGQSLAVLWDVVSEERYPFILRKYKEVDSNHGFMANNTAPDRLTLTRSIQTSTDHYSTLWPFINGYGILALDRMGQRDWAMRQFQKWSRLKEFREWYDPVSGKGFGEKEQMWSAALYLTVSKKLYDKV